MYLPTYNKDYKVQGCISSYYMYSSTEEQLASIVSSLIKGLYFYDGYKRTAVSAYFYLCDMSGLRSIQDDNLLLEIVLDIAKNKYDITTVAKKLTSFQDKQSLKHNQISSNCLM